MDELKDRGYDLIITNPIFYCNEFEDKSVALEITRLPNMCLRTKASNVIYQHLQEFLQLGMIKIYPISTHDQVATMFIKHLTENNFVNHHGKVCSR